MSDAYDVEALRPMILLKNGNIVAIADEIAADSEDLRNFVMNTPVLRRALDEVIHRGVDRAVAVLFEGLDDDEHYSNKLASAKEFLKSRAAQRRGFHAGGDLELRVPKQGGALTLTWLPPDRAEPVGPMIEGKVESEE